jgi:probable HAF family extracellular repeat protein
LTCITAITVFTALAIPVGLRLAAQEQGKAHTRYKLIDLGTLGGPNSFTANFGGGGVQNINNEGTVLATSETSIRDTDYPNSNPIYQSFIGPDPDIFHAFQWQKGEVTDLGALPGVNSSYANWISGNGLIAGVSETGAIDPLTGWPEAHATLWKDSQIIDFGTFGGNESFAYALNNRAQVIGGAANTIPDPFSAQGWGTQTRAFLWQDGVMQDLGTLGGTDAFATSINERGQIVGCAYTAPPNSTNAPFLWENGTMINLGTFGGTNGCAGQINNHGQVMGGSNFPGDQVAHGFFWERGVFTDLGNFGGNIVEPFWLNDVGEVVGGADYPGDTIRHAFLWKKGVMTDLGTVYPTCTSSGSVADSSNSRSQIVGNSWCDNTTFAGFLWEKGGPMIDLNSLISSNSSLQVLGAQSINERGEISGLGFLPSTGEVRAVLLIPCGEGTEGCGSQTESAAAEIRPRVVLPENIRKLLRHVRPRYHVPGPRQR